MQASPYEQRKGITLNQHLAIQQKLVRGTGEFSTIVSQIALIAKVISRELSRAWLFNAPRSGQEQGTILEEEDSRHMSDFMNHTFVKFLKQAPAVSAIVSSEMALPIYWNGKSQGGKYVVTFAPLSGITNLEVNGAIGSIFSIMRCTGNHEQPTPKDLMQRGADLEAAGYIMYGASTVMVYSCGHGVNMYALDSGIGEFMTCSENIRIPERGLQYSCNEAFYQDWEPATRRFIDTIRKRDPLTGKHYSARYAGALVADFHRTLIRGGIYLAPDETGAGGTKLRLLHKCSPLAYIAEQAGGRATTGTERITKILPTELHQRTEFVVGSAYEVLLYEDFVHGRK